MPYITKENRIKFDDVLKEYARLYPLYEIDQGDLNYLITSILKIYIKENGLKYQFINDVVGILECVKAEFQRRIVAGYEDTKILENGDV